MKRCLCAALCLQLAYVLSAPTQAPSTELESNNVEQELVNHIHAAADDTPNNGHHAGNSEKSSEESMDEESWYDITVGDVIFDVLLTLRQHPEIVKELIESEKEKIAEQIDTYNNFRDKVVNPSEFEDTAEQLNNVRSQRVVKKAGREGMSVYPAEVSGLDTKSAVELTNDGVTSEDSDDNDTHELDEWPGVMADIKEGGQDDPMFNYEKENNGLNYANQQGADFAPFRYPFNMAFPAMKPGSTGAVFADENDSNDSKPPHSDDKSTGAAEDKTDEDDSEELHEHPLPPGPERPYQDEDIVKM